MKGNLVVPITDKSIVEGLLPQNPPFIFVDTLLEIGEKTGRIGFTVPAENILVENNRLSEAGVLEHIAQSAALQNAYRQLLNGNKKAKTGVLIALDRIKINRLPKVGQSLLTIINIENEFFGMQLFSFETLDQDDELVAKGSLKTAMK